MPSIISRLNCFSKRSKEKEDGSHAQLLTSATSSATSPTSTWKTSETSKLSISPHPTQNNHHKYDDESIPTVDPDYNHVGNMRISNSVADGTIGSQDQSLTGYSQANTSVFGTVNNASITGGDHRYSSHLPPPQHEEMLEIYAPAGKLGLVIDTSEEASTPFVHAIKDTCPIRNDIYVGDKLIAVDDVDVRDMSSMEVSRLISRKSGQEKRKLTIIRTAMGRDGMY